MVYDHIQLIRAIGSINGVLKNGQLMEPSEEKGKVSKRRFDGTMVVLCMSICYCSNIWHYCENHKVVFLQSYYSD